MIQKILLFLILLIIPSLSQPFGQASKNYHIKKIFYENSSGEKGTTIFYYTDSGKMIEGVWYLNNKKRSSNNFYRYNQKGNLKTVFREFSDGKTSAEIFNYDSKGNKVSEYFYRSDSVSGSAIHLYKNGKIIKSIFNKHKGYLTGKIIYNYDDLGKKINGKLFNKDKVVCIIYYDYDINQNLIKETWDYFGNWNQVFSYNYELKNQNKKQFYSLPYFSSTKKYRIKKENYTFDNEVGGPSFYLYNDNNLLEKKRFVRSDSISTLTTYNYDEENKLTKSTRKYSDGKIGKFTYEYDNNKNLILRTAYKNDVMIGFESYLYSSTGKLIKAHYENSDNWLTGDILFKYDETGKLTEGKFKGLKGFDADIKFHYNINLCLTDIIWKFSFGKFQKYSFEYEEYLK